MKSLIQLLTAVSALFIVTSCGPTQYASSSNAMIERDALYDNSWDLVEINGTPYVSTADRYSYLTFTPNSNRIAGYTSCNQLGGDLTLTGAKGISFSPTITTKNTCADNTLDASLAPALRNVDSWAIVNDDLVMYRSGKAIARWAPAKYKSDDLYGNWQLSNVSGSDMPFEVLYPADKRPTIVFAEGKNMINGTTGYNTISCPTSITGNGIKFNDCTSTKVACEGPGEALFMDNLKTINHYRLVDDKTLVLVTADNKVMRFTRL